MLCGTGSATRMGAAPKGPNRRPGMPSWLSICQGAWRHFWLQLGKLAALKCPIKRLHKAAHPSSDPPVGGPNDFSAASKQLQLIAHRIPETDVQRLPAPARLHRQPRLKLQPLAKTDRLPSNPVSRRLTIVRCRSFMAAAAWKCSAACATIQSGARFEAGDVEHVSYGQELVPVRRHCVVLSFVGMQDVANRGVSVNSVPHSRKFMHRQ